MSAFTRDHSLCRKYFPKPDSHHLFFSAFDVRRYSAQTINTITGKGHSTVLLDSCPMPIVFIATCDEPSLRGLHPACADRRPLDDPDADDNGLE